ncbi:hypothetical protein [Pelomonas sp. Root1444]|uniref:hypothetical protein n=1 Tax=Pelomonas sp. Root1444 TaxID=1736464 RepID=UPI000702BCA0|nr:hypothetical protein [Pelomonas sp. Root1444]KQY83723.1 hypothetical protein ASD35_24180 [Pelomonas sp. Root1444]
MSVRPITDTLRLLDGGAFMDRCSDELAALVKAVEGTGKSGKLSITLALKTVGNGAVQITPTVAAAVPEPKPDTTLLWATVEGNLVVDNPAQQKLDLRQVDTRPAELRTAS